MAGEDRTVLRDGGFAGGGYSAETGELYYVAVQCGVLIPALRENLPLYASTLFLMVLVLLGLTRYLSRRVTEPVEELSARAKAGEPCPEDGPIRELNTLATAVNAGRGRLEEQLSRERAFTRAAAHELKTPLAVLRTHAEALREDIAPPGGGNTWTWCWTRATAWPLWWAACWSSPAWRRAGRCTGGAGDGRPGAGGL